MLTASEKSSWIELSAQAMRTNISLLRTLLEVWGHSEAQPAKPQLGIVLKANAYGHGLIEVLSVIHPLVDIIHLISPTDALRIRSIEQQNGWSKRRILVIGASSPDEFVRLAENDIEVTLADHAVFEAAQALRAANLKAVAHVHIETGLSREGFFPNEISTQLAFLGEADSPFLVKGALSHFANTEDVTEQQYALEQVARFHEGVAVLELVLSNRTVTLEKHIAASAATFVLSHARFDAVRVGIAFYGFWPSNETRLSARITLPEQPKLMPVLSWKCRSQIVKRLSAGSFVGYGCTYRCERETCIAVLPVGYYDGYPRLLSGRAHVLVHGHRAPVLGRVMMNHIVVDITGLSVDESPVTATLIGRDGHEVITAEMLAGWAQTIHYEVVARLGAHLKRIVIE